MSQTDTITALATPPGRGSIGILRVSGQLSAAVAQAILGTLPHSRQATYLPFYEEDGTTLDQGIALFFQRPNSFTGEDVLELQGHGGPIILDLLLKRILSLPGIRLARPGEFSERAFLNNRLDLSQAEAIADLIDANSAQAARSAVNSLQGAFSKLIYRLLEDITNLRIYIEAAIDFPDEDINPLSTNIIENKLNNIITSLEQVRTEASQGNLLREGMKVVITGKPNAGKSSLLNALLGWNAAIVTAISGTTRDVLREQINIDGMPLNIIDTAGIHNTNNEIEIIGIKRAWCEINNADHVLLIVDGTVNHNKSVKKMLWSVFKERLPQKIPVTIVRNKADITGERVGISEASGNLLITLSAKSGAGIDVLRKHLKHQMGFTGKTEGSFLARRRHLDALKKVAVHLSKSKEQLISNANDEIIAEELRLAQQSLSEITGEFTSNDLLHRIFSSFCIGK